MLSIVIPIHNEAQILESLVKSLETGLRQFENNYELVLCENGSTDRTLALAQALAQENNHLVVLTSDQASYGQAIRSGILSACGDQIIVFNADLWDLDFLRIALELLEKNDIVIASKGLPESHDQRPFNRRFITWAFNRVLRIFFNFTGSDTHGMKAFRRQRIVPVVERCITEREIFDTEVILRAQQAGLSTVEVPVDVEETRPSRYSPFVRIPRTLKDLSLLYRDLYLTPKSAEFNSELDKV